MPREVAVRMSVGSVLLLESLANLLAHIVSVSKL